ncbi:GTP 3',8-cyclase MoaA [Actinoalloteichus hymeniacidonis]|uniref:GTP 3',8-cyclase n=1 Tax=Actinoalloteichus hymeniacidonis TaxID=340345 RepID=A0AAC9HVC0_9PSEU|nr:GTP 3',8-cyclase MoaA [Actinoalloteichus hymeniacidonis]AOS65831.1 molybdenum cofactor biosynthesis protein A [Actinoalloteichus hymeniacidonis]MBB5906078.1 cyclic pyranopterin phosphate synthase [Actinoalloteichus hymeniacidonis]
MSAVELGIPTVPGAVTGPSRPEAAGLIDRYGRTATDLRVSLIDRCNLRCSYCMPAEGLDWLAKSSLLDTAEVNRLLRVAVERLGVRDVRFTGGEPLLRKDLAAIVHHAAGLQPKPKISLTTNAIVLADRAAELAEAGLDRINVSLDTLRPELFHTITRRRRLDDVLAGLAAARAAGLDPVKINAVLLRGINDDEAPDLLRFAIDEGYHLRFIEQMPLDAQHGWQRSTMVTAAETLALLRSRFDLAEHDSERGSAPAERWTVDGGPATVGIIGSVTRPFCAACDRTRLTADGQIRSCLFSQTETDLRGPLRSGAGDEELAEIWREAMWGKRAGHGIDDESFTQPRRPMSAIGG